MDIGRFSVPLGTGRMRDHRKIFDEKARARVLAQAPIPQRGLAHIAGVTQ